VTRGSDPRPSALRLVTDRQVRPGAIIPRNRLFALLGVLALAFAAIVVRLTYVQGVSAGPYTEIGLSERIHTQILPADRGSIFDRNGDELAISVPQSTIWADPLLVTAPASEAEQLAPVLGMTTAAVLSRLTAPGQFAYIERTVPDSVAAGVEKLKLPGIEILDEPKRFDPDGPLASPVIGVVGTDGTGLSGLEYQYNSELIGHPGKLVSEDDPGGDPIPGGFQRLTPATKGSDLVLTIDRSLQFEVEQDLAAEITSSQARGGMAVVLDRRTGDILAMASLQNSPEGVIPTINNDATDAVYEPGSVQKLVTVSAALQEGTIQPTTVLTVPDRVDVAGTEINDDNTHPVEQWTPTDILTASSNVGALEIAAMLGKAGLVKYIHDFGEGSATALHFPGESAGLLLPPDEWSGTTDATVAFGQGISVTALQIAAAYNAIANGGVYVAPRLVDAMVNSQGQTIQMPPSATHEVVSPLVAREMTAMLTEVTRGGTGTAAAINGYQVAGKTGTAQLAVQGHSGYETGAYYASFAGFVPATSPAFTALVVLEQPTTIYGGTAAAPVFQKIATYALRELQIPPPPPDPDLFDGVPHAQSSSAAAAAVPGGATGDTESDPSGLLEPPPPATTLPPGSADAGSVTSTTDP
jgi:cell division protein FtsI (penicillin-binding protein 3)